MDLHRSRGGTLNELRFHHDFRLIVGGLLDLVDDCFRRNLAHSREALADCGQLRFENHGQWYVVESNDRDVLWHAQPCLLKRLYGSDCRDVLERKKSGKAMIPR